MDKEQVKEELKDLAKNHEPTATALIDIFETEMLRGKSVEEAYMATLQRFVEIAEEHNPAKGRENMTDEQKAEIFFRRYLSGGYWTQEFRDAMVPPLVRFLRDEREANAKLSDAVALEYRALANRPGGSAAHYGVSAAERISKAIRARSLA